ncbi:putative uncharacterized protein (plasmid) [Aliivibrio wodanis]|uniref:DUF2971 domain-containing protein n=1 Tax=Aliivibrio wodanis TaxID=80852 RepID=A0A090IE97_9GAMM|nr:putative uncharacterized protein [Aliivibrio wodanis]
MILYKYVSLISAIEIIKNRSLGFTCLEDLNDPFEGTNFGFSDVGDVSPRSATNAFKSNFSRKYSVLSLTRNPLNPLMWSHYGDSYKGIVIGIDVDIANLTSESEFIIPAHMGEISYVATKNRDLNGVPSVQHLNSIKKELEFKNEIQNNLKQAFLYKAIEWGYEEEIRVIKSLLSFNYSYHGTHDEVINDCWDKRRLSSLGQPLFCFKIPINSIKEIYLGEKIDRNRCRTNNGQDEEKFQENLKFIKSQDCPIYVCEADVSSWKLKARLLDSCFR